MSINRSQHCKPWRARPRVPKSAVEPRTVILPSIDPPEKSAKTKPIIHSSLSTYSTNSISGNGRLINRPNAPEQIIDRLSRLNIRKTFRRKFSPMSDITLQTSDDVANYILDGNVQNIVVMTGAGISTPSGIPDFRTPGTGLYDNLQQYNIPYPEAIFDIDYFHENPKPFYALAKELYPSGKYRPNYVHYFLRHLHDRGLLLRLYTQNIDGLERIAGIPSNKLVEAHGTFMSSHCVRCRRSYSTDVVKKAIFDDVIPKCTSPGCKGVIKPDIVFFGEDLPRRFHLYEKDVDQADLLIILGTSLEVYPFAGIIDSVRPNVSRLLFNHVPVGPFRLKNKRTNDLASIGDILEQVTKFVGLLGWTRDLEELIKASEPNDAASLSTDFEKLDLSKTALSDTKDGIKQTNSDGVEQTHTDGIKQTHTDGIKQTHTDGIKQTHTDGIKQMHTDGIKQTHTNGIKHKTEIPSPTHQKVPNAAQKNKTVASFDAQCSKASAINFTTFAKNVTSFNAQKELYRTNKKTESSDSETSDTSSSSDDESR